MTRLDLNKRKILFWILSLICMIIIFCFSSKNADESTVESHKIGKTIGHMVKKDFDKWPEEKQEAYAIKIDHPVRKAAHFIEYMTLGFLLTAAWYDKKYRKIVRIMVPFLIGAVYSMSDEIHQTLVSGRAGMITDVLLDSTGVITGVILSSLFIKIITKISDIKTRYNIAKK